MRTITITVSEFSGTPDASTRHFEARLDPDGTLLISGVDDESWAVCPDGSPAARILAAVFTPSVSRVDDLDGLGRIGIAAPVKA